MFVPFSLFCSQSTVPKSVMSSVHFSQFTLTIFFNSICYVSRVCPFSFEIELVGSVLKREKLSCSLEMCNKNRS